jgi:O-antigen ligase
MTFLRHLDSPKKIIFNIFLFIWLLSIPFKNAIYQASVILLVIFFIVDIFQSRRLEVLIQNLKKTKILAASFFLLMFSMILSNMLNLEYLDKKSWHMVYMFAIRYALIFVILAYYYKLEYFSKNDFIVMLYLSFSYLALTGMYTALSLPEDMFISGLKGTLDYRNAFGLLMGMGLVLSVLLFDYKKKLSMILILIFSTLMLLSVSRSSWVSSFFAIAVLFLINYRKFKSQHIVSVLIIFSFIVLIYFSFDSIQHRFSSLLQGDSSGRFEIWAHTINLIEQKIYFGHGIDTWMNLSDSFLKQYPDPHNMVLEILLCTGILGLIAVVTGIFAVLVEIYKQQNYKLFAIATYFLVITQFDFGAFGSKELLSFLTAFVFFVYLEKFKPIQHDAQ